VSLEVLSRVYDNMRNQGDRSHEDSRETLDPDSHLHFVDAFDMPLWHWSGERGTFEK
jgi:DNA polymerase epsilon subunit 2